MKKENSVLDANIKRDGKGPDSVGGNGRTGRCIFCHGKVKSGGDRHGKNKCSVRGIFGDHRRKLRASKRSAKRKQNLVISRGAPVAGIHRVSASSGESRKKAKATV